MLNADCMKIRSCYCTDHMLCIFKRAFFLSVTVACQSYLFEKFKYYE